VPVPLQSNPLAAALTMAKQMIDNRSSGSTQAVKTTSSHSGKFHVAILPQSVLNEMARLGIERQGNCLNAPAGVNLLAFKKRHGIRRTHHEIPLNDVCWNFF